MMRKRDKRKGTRDRSYLYYWL